MIPFNGLRPIASARFLAAKFLGFAVAVFLLLALVSNCSVAQSPLYPLIVAGAPALDAFYANGSLVVRFHRSPAAAGGDLRSYVNQLKPGDGSWVDRPVNEQEPTTLVKAATAQEAATILRFLHHAGGFVTFACRNTSEGYFEALRVDGTYLAPEQTPPVTNLPTSFPRKTDHLTSHELLASLSESPTVGPKGQTMMSLRRMVNLPPICPEGLKLTEDSEGWEDHLYNDAANYCTIGYGHLLRREPCDGTGIESQYLNGLRQAPDGAKLLENDLYSAHYTVVTEVTPKMTDQQVAAITDFVFNVGSGNFRKSTLKVVLNSGDFTRVRSEMMRWVVAGGRQWPGLAARRQKEVNLFYGRMMMTESLRLDHKQAAQPAATAPLIDLESGEGARH